MVLILLMIVLTFVGLLKSQEEFNNHFGNLLGCYPTKITFREAVEQFDTRSDLLCEGAQVVLPCSL